MATSAHVDSSTAGYTAGDKFHGCSYAAALLVTRVPHRASAQVSGVRGVLRSPHLVDNPGGRAPCRPVDDRPRCAHALRPAAGAAAPFLVHLESRRSPEARGTVPVRAP